MAKVDSFVCDECGKRRDKDTNRWWVLIADPPDRFLGVYPWPVSCMTSSGHHTCGEACAQKAFSKWLANGTFEARERGFEERGTVSGTAAAKES